MSIYDYIVIAFYFVFMAALGPVYKSFSRTASDFFRGGGGMLWWMVGSSAFMTAFSAWSFTGGAAKAYETGTFFLLLFGCNFVGLWLTYFYLAARFRQMRIITAVEGVRKRYGNVNEQVFAWLPVPLNIIWGGLGLYVITVFIYGVFRNEPFLANVSPSTAMGVMIVAMGLTVMLMTLFGGSWAATAGDFVQMLVVLTITILLAYLTLTQPEIGGLTGLIEHLPKHHFDWTHFERPWIIVFFAFTLLINQTVQNNSLLAGASKFVFVKNGRDAQKATLLSIIGFLLLSPIWIIPAMAAAIYFPNLAESFPELGASQGNSAAYVAMAIKLLPSGLLGMLVCGIFAASITSMNSALNIAAGTFVRNVWIRIVEPGASEKKQIMVGRIFIFIYSLLMIALAFIFLENKEMSLFDIVLILAASVGLPTAAPMFLGVFIKRTPPWAGWSTMLVGFVFAVAINLVFYLVPAVDLFNVFLRPQTPFTRMEAGDMQIATTTFILFVVTSYWYLRTIPHYKNSSEAYREQVDEFFEEMNTPIDQAAEHGPDYDNDARQNRVMGLLCMIYGVFILLMLLIPNTWKARGGILFCGGTITATGVILLGVASRLKRQVERPAGDE